MLERQTPWELRKQNDSQNFGKIHFGNKRKRGNILEPASDDQHESDAEQAWIPHFKYFTRLVEAMLWKINTFLIRIPQRAFFLLVEVGLSHPMHHLIYCTGCWKKKNPFFSKGFPLFPIINMLPPFTFWILCCVPEKLYFLKETHQALQYKRKQGKQASL